MPSCRRLRPFGDGLDRQAARRPLAAGRVDAAARLRQRPAPARGARRHACGARPYDLLHTCSAAAPRWPARSRSPSCRSRCSPRAATPWTRSWRRSSSPPRRRARAARDDRPSCSSARVPSSGLRSRSSSSRRSSRRRRSCCCGCGGPARGPCAGARSGEPARRSSRSRSRGWSRWRSSPARTTLGVRLDERLGVERDVRLRRRRPPDRRPAPGAASGPAGCGATAAAGRDATRARHPCTRACGALRGRPAGPARGGCSLAADHVGARVGLELGPRCWRWRRRCSRAPAAASTGSAAPAPGRCCLAAAGIVLFSAQSSLRPRYLEALDPAIAAVLGVAVVLACGSLTRRSWRRGSRGVS